MKSTVSVAAGLALSMGAFGQGGEAVAEPPVDLSKPTLYVVAYAHLDTQWRWAYPETIRDFLAHTLHRNFDLIEKHPGYVFNFSGSRRYAMMKEYYPGEYEKLKGYIRAGRWFPCGSSVDENDANVPSAESLVRQVLYGNHYFRREFGVASEEFMLPDCFGFPAALPQVLAHCGLRGFSTQKLTWNACVPIPFKVGVWLGPDGTGLVSALDPGAYVGEVREDLSTSNAWLARINANGQKSGVFVDYHYYGTGDQGGAPKPESVAMVEQSRTGAGPIRVLHARADDMFKAITPEMAANMPTYQGELELTQHSAGSVTSQAYMKRWNRRNELLADAAEKAAVAAMLLGPREYPSKTIEDAWYLVLGSQMHDILPGTSLPKAYEYSWNDEVLAGNLFSQVLEDSASAVIASMDTGVSGTPVVVFNPTSAEREDVVEARVPFKGGVPAAVSVIGPDGNAVEAQVLSTDKASARVAFVAKVPQVGFAVYGVSFDAARTDAESTLRVSERSLENARYAVTLNDDGDVSSIKDKQARQELLSAPIRLGLHYENPANWPAWNQDWEDRVKPAKSFVAGPAAFEIVERGPARVALRVSRECEGSTFLQTISLSAGTGGERVEFDNDILWNSRERSLRVAFPLSVSNPVATFDIQAGAIERPNSHPQQYEYGFHQWIDLTTPDKGDLGLLRGVTLMCDSKYGCDKPDDNTLRITLLHTPGTRGGYQDQGTQDLGRHRVKFALCGHVGSWQSALIPLHAARLNQPLIPFVATAHPGRLGKTFSLIRVSDPSVAITAVKKTEDSDDVVVRLRELSGGARDAVSVSLASPLVSAAEVDGQERRIGDAAITDGAILTSMRGYSLRAFALRPTAPGPKSAAAASIPIPLPYDTDAVSTNENRKDGDFDGRGNSIPGEQLVSPISSGGVAFTLGPTDDGKNNAVACRGQTINIPGGVDRVWLLAAANEDITSTISVGGIVHPWSVQAWTGFIGQWDCRLWQGDTPDSAYNWSNDIAGLVPGYIKPDPVAWFSTHHHNPGGDAHYEFCYLYRYAVDVSPGTKAITLPNDPRIKVMSATGVTDGPRRATAAAPLFDTLDHEGEFSAPKIVVAAGPDNDAREVSVSPGLYWRAGAFRVTLDGSIPTPESPAYTGPIWVSMPTTMKVAQVALDGSVVGIVEHRINVTDRTPPRMTKVSGVAMSPRVVVGFSEPVEPLDPARVALGEVAQVRAVDLSQDGLSAVITLDSPLESGKSYALKISGPRDRSPAHNDAGELSAKLIPAGPVYTLDEVSEKGIIVKDVPGLPVKSGDAWTLNMWVKASKQPSNRTVFAGFGACRGGRTGGGRFLSKFANGVHFWSDNQDVESRSPLELNRWQMLTATYDGTTLRLYHDGKIVGEDRVSLIDDENIVHITPKDPWDKRYQFEGEIRGVSIWNAALDDQGLAALKATAPR